MLACEERGSGAGHRSHCVFILESLRPTDGERRIGLQLVAVQVLPEGQAQVEGEAVACEPAARLEQVDPEDDVDALTAVVVLEGSRDRAPVGAHSVDAFLPPFKFAGIVVAEAAVQAEPFGQVVADPAKQLELVAEAVVVVVFIFQADHAVGLCSPGPVFELLHESQGG